jgi:hypothetical protein
MLGIRRPGHGTAVAYLALFIALGGTAYAANTVGSDDIIDDSIQSVDIKDKDVKAVDLAKGAVTTAAVKDNSLTTADIAGIDSAGKISISAASVPNGQCRQFTLLFGGAKAGEGVTVSAQAPLQNGVVLYAQQVPSDGHVTADLCNLSGTTLAGLTDFPIQVITFG